MFTESSRARQRSSSPLSPGRNGVVVEVMEIWRSFTQYLVMVCDDDFSVLEPFGNDVEIAAAYVREHDEVGVNSSDLLDRFLAEIFHDPQVNNSIETFHSLESYCAGG